MLIVIVSVKRDASTITNTSEPVKRNEKSKLPHIRLGRYVCWTGNDLNGLNSLNVLN
jgi:hypothetical protein